MSCWRPTLLKPRWARILILVVTAALLLAFAMLIWPEPARRVARRVMEPTSLARIEVHAPLIRAAASEQGVDPCLVAGVIYAESRGQIDAVSTADALGLMQLTLASAGDAARALDLERPTREALLSDAELNIRLGTRHFAWTLEHEQNHPERALAAYNAGSGRLRRWIDEAGSYEKWRAKQLRDGDSMVLAYAMKVLDYSEVFRERGVIDGREAPELAAGEPAGSER